MAFEDRLRSALEDAVKFCNGGSTPDEAVCKSASAAGFNRDQTDRLVETLNTAITINQYKQASDKTASFPLAHKDKVASMMLDADKVLGTSEKKAETQHVYFEYLKPAYDYVKHADDVEVKAAGSEEKTTGLSLDNLAYLSIQQMKLVKNAADYANNVAGIIKGNLVTKLYDFADAVKKAGVTKYARFKTSTEHKGVLKELDKVLPVKFKEAECNDALVDDSDLVDFEKTAEDMANDMVSLKEMRDQAKVMHKQAADMESQITDAFVEKKEEGPSTFFGLLKVALSSSPPEKSKEDLLKDIKDLTEKNTRINSDFDESKKRWEKQRENYGDRIDSLNKSLRKTKEKLDNDRNVGLLDLMWGKRNPNEMLGARDLPFYSAENIESLLFDDKTSENDKTERTIENVKRSLMLQDLMINDEIISEADPDIVASTYNSLIQTAPGVASNKEVVRAILRQAINSIAISPYDASTWADLEKKQRESVAIQNRQQKNDTKRGS